MEDLLQRHKALQDRLQAVRSMSAISSIQSLAPFLPSRQRQEADRDLLKQSLVVHARRLRQELSAIGLSSDITDRLLQDLRRPLSYLHWISG